MALISCVWSMSADRPASSTARSAAFFASSAVLVLDSSCSCFSSNATLAESSAACFSVTFAWIVSYVFCFSCTASSNCWSFCVMVESVSFFSASPVWSAVSLLCSAAAASFTFCSSSLTAFSSFSACASASFALFNSFSAWLFASAAFCNASFAFPSETVFFAIVSS